MGFNGRGDNRSLSDAVLSVCAVCEGNLRVQSRPSLRKEGVPAALEFDPGTFFQTRYLMLSQSSSA